MFPPTWCQLVVLHVLFLMLLARFEVPLGPMGPSAQGEVVGIKARRPEDFLITLLPQDTMG